MEDTNSGYLDIYGIKHVSIKVFILDIISKKPHSTLNMFHESQRISKEFTRPSAGTAKVFSWESS